MIIVISPAKTLDFDSPLITRRATQPAFLDQSEELMERLVHYSPNQLGKLMKISHDLSELNVERNLNWSRPFNRKNARPAMLTFKGDVYLGLKAEEFSDEDIDYAQNHLRILSGLYGVLRPLDLMQAYRLEMGTRLKTDRGKDLYEFWGDQISLSLNKQLKKTGADMLLNLASNEYFGAVENKALKAEIISPVFKDWKNGEYKLISFFAKKARGSMAAWVIKNQVKDSSDLKKFDVDGYRFSAEQSTELVPVFLRDAA